MIGLGGGENLCVLKSLHTHCGLLVERFHLSLQSSSVTVYGACVNHPHQPILHYTQRVHTHTHSYLFYIYTYNSDSLSVHACLLVLV